MGRPGSPWETVAGTQLSGAPEALGDDPSEAAPTPEDSDMVPSVTLAAALTLLLFLLSAWLIWDAPLQGAPPCGLPGRIRDGSSCALSALETSRGRGASRVDGPPGTPWLDPEPGHSSPAATLAAAGDLKTPATGHGSAGQLQEPEETLALPLDELRWGGVGDS